MAGYVKSCGNPVSSAPGRGPGHPNAVILSPCPPANRALTALTPSDREGFSAEMRESIRKADAVPVCWALMFAFSVRPKGGGVPSKF